MMMVMTTLQVRGAVLRVVRVRSHLQLCRVPSLSTDRNPASGVRRRTGRRPHGRLRAAQLRPHLRHQTRHTGNVIAFTGYTCVCL